MKRRKLLLKLVFLAVILLIIFLTFRKSLGDIVFELQSCPLRVLVQICCFSIIYHLFEGWTTMSLGKRCNPDFKYRWGVFSAFYCSFYRLTTMGTAPGVAAVVYFEKHDVSYSEGIALYTIQYSIHKVSIALFALVLFISNWQYMVTRFHSYIALLFIAFFITIVICVLVILLVLSPVFHKKILAFARWLNRRGRFERLVDRLEAEVSIMEGVSRRIIRDAKQVIYLVAVNFVKQFFWFAIPFLILSDGVLPLSLFQSLSVTSLAVMTAAVIPTPSGIGSLELIMTGLYSVIAGVDRAGAVLVLYRIATFFFPFFAGAVLVLLRRAVRKTKIQD